MTRETEVEIADLFCTGYYFALFIFAVLRIVMFKHPFSELLKYKEYYI